MFTKQLLIIIWLPLPSFNFCFICFLWVWLVDRPQTDGSYVHWQDRISRPAELVTMLRSSCSRKGCLGGQLCSLDDCLSAVYLHRALMLFPIETSLAVSPSAHGAALDLPERSTPKKRLSPTPMWASSWVLREHLMREWGWVEMNKTVFYLDYSPGFIVWISESRFFQTLGVFLFLLS